RPEQVIDADGGVEAEVLRAAQVRAHLGERRGPGPEREARDAQAELDRRRGAHRSPSSFFASATVRPPTRPGRRPPSGTPSATGISLALGASTRRTSMASKCVRTKAASL